MIVSGGSGLGSVERFVIVLEVDVPNNGLKKASTELLFLSPFRPRAEINFQVQKSYHPPFIAETNLEH